MLTLILVLFVGLVLYSVLKGELQYVRDTLEIQLRQARFRLDRLERRVRELEEPATHASLRGVEASNAQMQSTSDSSPPLGASVEPSGPENGTMSVDANPEASTPEAPPAAAAMASQDTDASAASEPSVTTPPRSP